MEINNTGLKFYVVHVFLCVTCNNNFELYKHNITSTRKHFATDKN